jgi:hypothetical protein
MDHSPPDDDEREQDFLARHGGPGSKARRQGESDKGFSGWSEVYAADGYALRCEWTAFGARQDTTYSEIAPAVES